MLLKSLYCVLLFTTYLRYCHCNCHTVPTDLNTKWREADVLMKYFHIYLQNQPATVEDECDSQKRYVAVYSHALMEYITNNITDDKESIREAAHRTRKILAKPSSVLIASMRAFNSKMLSLIDQPVADVQRACPYNVRQSECSAALSNLHGERTKKCPNYSRNLALYNHYKVFANSCGFKQLLDNLLQESANGADYEAIDFFIEAAGFKHKSILNDFKSFATMDWSKRICTTMAFL